MKAAVQKKLKKIKLLIVDVDGVLTDGRIVIDADGREIKYFNVYDGYALVLFKRAGHKTAILSAREAPAVTARAEDLKIDKICQNAQPKLAVYESLLQEMNLKDEEVCFVADDLPDIEVLKRAGVGVAVKNARPEAKKAADHVTTRCGGEGAVREVVEDILKAQKLWRRELWTAKSSC